MLKKFIEMQRELFEKRISVKTGWGKNEVMIQLLESTNEAMAELLNSTEEPKTTFPSFTGAGG